MFELASVSVGSIECRWVYAVLTALWNIFEKTKYEMEVGNIEIYAVFSCICQKLKLFLNFKGEIRLEITINMELIMKRDIKRVFLTCRIFFMTFLHISHSWTGLLWNDTKSQVNHGLFLITVVKSMETYFYNAKYNVCCEKAKGFLRKNNYYGDERKKHSIEFKKDYFTTIIIKIQNTQCCVFWYQFTIRFIS